MFSLNNELATRVAYLEANQKQVPTPPSSSNWTAVMKSLLVQSFNMDELIDLCLRLEIKHDSLDHDNTDVLSSEIVLHCDRRGMSHLLLEHCQDLRENIFWPHI